MQRVAALESSEAREIDAAVAQSCRMLTSEKEDFMHSTRRTSSTRVSTPSQNWSQILSNTLCEGDGAADGSWGTVDVSRG
eukprot:6182565-Pleurochrysis_carterae.AAC.1